MGQIGQSLYFYAPTVAAQQVVFIGVKQFPAQKITRYSFVLQHNGVLFTTVHGASVAFVTGVFINHHNFTRVCCAGRLLRFCSETHLAFVGNVSLKLAKFRQLRRLTLKFRDLKTSFLSRYSRQRTTTLSHLANLQTIQSSLYRTIFTCTLLL